VKRRIAAAVLMAGFVIGTTPATSAPAGAAPTTQTPAAAIATVSQTTKTAECRLEPSAIDRMDARMLGHMSPDLMGIPDCDQAQDDCNAGSDCAAWMCCEFGGTFCDIWGLTSLGIIPSQRHTR